MGLKATGTGRRRGVDRANIVVVRHVRWGQRSKTTRIDCDTILFGLYE